LPVKPRDGCGTKKAYMNLNTSIIDQRLLGIQDEIRAQARAELGIADDNRLKSLAFVYLCVKVMLDLDADAAFDCLTEGSGDFGVDALHVSEDMDGEFDVTLFQGKCKRDLAGDAHFPAGGIAALINAVTYLFDPQADLGDINDRLRVGVEQARAMIRDGVIPRVRVIACNNGEKWHLDGQALIDLAGFGGQVTWEHVNHDVLVGILQNTKPVSETLRLVGKAVVEDMNFSRVCIGRIAVTEIAALMGIYRDRLLKRNIRRYLGLHGNRVNENISATLRHATEPENFYFFNNGLTLVCDDFKHNALQDKDFQIRVENLQIVNGGQTCMTIYKTAEALKQEGKSLSARATVLVRLYELPKNNEDIVLRITQATNSQNPVDLRNLYANHVKQRQLEADMAGLGYTYRRKRMETPAKPLDITSGAAAEAVLAVWRQAPHQAKFFTREHFGKLYDRIFTSALNGAQVVIACLLYRIAENHRRRPGERDPLFVRYASCFIAMQMGRRLLKQGGLTLDDLDYRRFEYAKQLVNDYGEDYFSAACQDIDEALKTLYGQQEISIQQLSATFRRGDLIAKLKTLFE